MGRGGYRPGAGRKSKAEEMGLAKLLDQCFVDEDRRKCIKALLEISRSRKASYSDRLKAIEMLLSYTYGRPRQAVELSGTVKHRTVEEMTDEELEAIAGGSGAADEEEGET